MSLRALSAAMLCLVACACVSNRREVGPPRLRGHFTIAASRKIENFAETTGAAKVSGRACRSLWHWLSVTMADDRVIERAVEDALSKAPGSNALTLVKIDFEESWIFCVTATGLAVTRR